MNVWAIFLLGIACGMFIGAVGATLAICYYVSGKWRK